METVKFDKTAFWCMNRWQFASFLLRVKQRSTTCYPTGRLTYGWRTNPRSVCFHTELDSSLFCGQSFAEYESVKKYDFCINLPSEPFAGHLKSVKSALFWRRPLNLQRIRRKWKSPDLFSMLILIFNEYFKEIFIPYFLVFVLIE